MPYIIRDTSTGMAYDIRAQDATALLSQEGEKLTTFSPSAASKRRPWEDWWKKKKHNNSKLLVAAEKGEKELVINLIDQKKHGDLAADVNAKGLDEFTPLHYAANEGHTEVVELLLRHGARVDAVSSTQRTPLHVACNRGLKEIAAFLLAAGANVNAQDKDGNTPAHILSDGGWQEALELLLKQGADMRIKNIYGETPTEVASSVAVRRMCMAASKSKSKEKAAPVPDTYRRTVVENVILHDNRADMVKSILGWSQRLSDAPEAGADTPVPKEPQRGKTKSRRIKIIEATRRLSQIGTEELKQAALQTQKGPESDPALGDKVGPDYFDIISMLGKGSFGEVYLVRYRPTGKLYAMKALNKKKMTGQNIMKYAQAERNVMRLSHHPFIVGLDFAFQTSEKLFMVLEYCPGYVRSG